METVSIVQSILALFFTLALVGVVSALLRRYGNGVGITRGATRRTNKRLEVKEMLTLDPRRRLVLIRRDDVEHLLLLGHEASHVVESNITPPEGEIAEDVDEELLENMDADEEAKAAKALDGNLNPKNVLKSGNSNRKSDAVEKHNNKKKKGL